MATIHDVLGFVAKDQLADAITATHDVLGHKVLQALEDRKIDLAQQLFPSEMPEAQ